MNSLDIEAQITSDPVVLNQAAGVIFPGVGAAGQAMNLLESRGLDYILRNLVAAQKPLLGICLGCQILLEESEEGPTRTLGILSGRCRRFNPAWSDGDRPIRIPHMGWNSLRRSGEGKNASRLLDGIAQNAQFYFVHSYYPQPDPALVIATTTYGAEFTSIYGRPGLWAAQFHPEKSGPPGLRLLANFYEYCRETANA